MAILSVTNLEKVDWGRSYLWDLQFPDPLLPSPFDTWFPAVDFNDSRLTSISNSVPWFIREYKFPVNAAANMITISFYDDLNGSLYTWLTNWYNYIYDDYDDGVCTIEDASKQMFVRKLDLSKNVLSSTLYLVYPEGPISDTWNSESGNKTYSLSLVVVGSQDASNVP
jgi:hypothetical protein